MPCVCSQKSVGFAGAAQAPKVCDGDGHFGPGDPVVVRRRPPRFEVHSEVTDGHVVHKRIWQGHFESFRGPLAVLVDADPSQLAQI